MAAAYKSENETISRHLKQCREIVEDKLWFLIPGIDTQGGLIGETVKTSFSTSFGSIAVNSSSKIIFASSDDDYAKEAGKETEKLENEIREVTDSFE